MTLKPCKVTFAYFLLFFCLVAKAQHIEVKGSIIDETTKTPIDFATVQIEETKNHRLLGYGFSDDKGNFVIETDIKEETDISLVVTYIGFTTFKKRITLNKLHYNAGQILLHESAEKLDEVVITATPPVLIKNDTMQFNAASFKTREDATAEDLFKKLPGVSVDNDDGSVQVNGVDVTRILVNGEPFFSNNPKVAMKIISKDMIEKIEITNTKSDENQFTGNEDDEEAKTMNIILKNRDKSNLFGNATAGIGTNDRYEANAVMNRMLNKSFFTLLAFTNNVNKNNFSYDEDNDNTFDRARAIRTATNVGANYSNKFDGGDKINIDYLFSDNEYDKGTRENRLSLVPGNTNSTISNSRDITNQNVNRLNFKMTNNLFDNFRLITSTNFFNRDRDFTRESDRETIKEDGEFANRNTGNFKQEQITRNINSNINAVYKFDKLNSFISYRIGTSNNSFDANSRNISETSFNSTREDVLRNQTILQNRRDFSISNTVKYNQRFLENHSVSYEFSHRKDKKEEDKETSDFDNNSNSFILNNGLSFDQQIDILKKEHKLTYGFRKNAIFFNIKAGQLTTDVKNKELNRSIGLNRQFKDYLFSSKFRYSIKKKLTINANYRTKSIVPKNNELLTITDNTNPLRINIGNPNLKRELEHLTSINIRTFNRKSKIFFFNRFSYTTVQDKIIDKTSVDDELVTTRSFINNSDNHKYSISGSISKDYKKSPVFYSFKMKWFASTGQNTHLINDVLFKSNFYTFSPSAYAEFNYNDIIEISPRYRLFLDDTKYDNNEIQDQSNIQHTFGLNITTFGPKRFTIFNQMQYNLNPRFEEGFGKQSLVWNITANYSIVPNKAKLKLTVFNILNQYDNTTRRLTESRNSTYTYDVLKQYFMLSFRYNFKNS